MESQTVKQLKALAKEQGIPLPEINPNEARKAQDKASDSQSVRNMFDKLILSQKCTVCKQTKPAGDFNTIKRNGDTRLAKSCILCNLIKTKEKKERHEKEFAHLWIREDKSKITDPYEIVDDNVPRRCNLCHAWKPPREFSIFGISLHPKLTRGCTSCLELNRKDAERRKTGDVKDSWYWNGHLITRKKKDTSTKCVSKYMTADEISKHNSGVANAYRSVMSSSRGFER